MHFIYKDGYGIRECTHIEAFKEELAWTKETVNGFGLSVIHCYLKGEKFWGFQGFLSDLENLQVDILLSKDQVLQIITYALNTM